MATSCMLWPIASLLPSTFARELISCPLHGCPFLQMHSSQREECNRSMTRPHISAFNRRLYMSLVGSSSGSTKSDSCRRRGSMSDIGSSSCASPACLSSAPPARAHSILLIIHLHNLHNVGMEEPGTFSCSDHHTCMKHPSHSSRFAGGVSAVSEVYRHA
jgi:hypothetical protein